MSLFFKTRRHQLRALARKAKQGAFSIEKAVMEAGLIGAIAERNRILAIAKSRGAANYEKIIEDPIESVFDAPIMSTWQREGEA